MPERKGWYTSRDGCTLRFREWQEDGDVILYLHGIESHSGWFSGFASMLHERGFAVYGIDRRGSGLNDQPRGDIQDYHLFYKDIEDALMFVRTRHAGKRVFLLGICWGGFLAANYVAWGGQGADGMIVLSPALYRKIDVSWYARCFLHICFRITPRFTFPIPIRDAMFTGNPEYRAFIAHDALRVRRLSCRFFHEITRMETRAAHSNTSIHIPLLVLLAGQDEIIDNDRVTEWFERVSTTDKSLRVFKEMRHVLPFEERADIVIDELASWIMGRTIADAGSYPAH